MKTWPLHDAQGRPYAFEVSNPMLLRPILGALRKAPGVSDITMRKMFRGPMDVHASFQFRGDPFIVWEPWGDNSRLWIGPEEVGDPPMDIMELLQAFTEAQPREVD